jgi:hypothetical protein
LIVAGGCQPRSTGINEGQIAKFDAAVTEDGLRMEISGKILRKRDEEQRMALAGKE